MNLLEEQLQSLIERYYAGEPVKTLIAEYGLSIHPGELVRRFPPVEHTGLCAQCGGHMQSRYAARDPRRPQIRLRPAQCTQCGHDESGSCNCAGCNENDRRRQEEELRLLRKRVAALRPTESRNVETLSLTEALYLVSLARAGASEDLALIEPIIHCPVPLAPTENLSRAVVEQLFAGGLIFIDGEHSPAYALTVDDSGSLRYYPDYIYWRINLESSNCNRAPIDTLMRTLVDGPWPESWRSELPELWAQLAVHECLAFLEVSAASRGFRALGGDRTTQALERVLTRFSIGQTCNFVWRSARNALDFYTTRRVTRPHAVNTIPGFCERQAEKTVFEGWEVKPFVRHLECPESVMAGVFATAVAQLGADYWYQTPSEAALTGQA